MQGKPKKEKEKIEIFNHFVNLQLARIQRFKLNRDSSDQS